MDIPKEYKNRPFLQGASRKNYRDVDRFPDHILGTYTPADPETPKATPPATYEIFRNGFFTIWSRTGKTYPCGSLVIDQKNDVKIMAVIKWVIQDPAGPLDIKKGLWICGPYGSGKTEFVKNIVLAANVAHFKFNNIRYFENRAYDHIYDNTRIQGNPDFIYQLPPACYYVDDLGYQDRVTAKLYGNTDNVLDILLTRLHGMHKNGFYHIATSNKTPGGMAENNLIHPGSYDRIQEMFNIVSWGGNSLR